MSSAPGATARAGRVVMWPLHEVAPVKLRAFTRSTLMAAGKEGTGWQGDMSRTLRVSSAPPNHFCYNNLLSPSDKTQS